MVKHLQSRTNNLRLSDSNLKKYSLLRLTLFKKVGVRCPEENDSSSDLSSSGLYLHCSNNCGSILLCKSKPTDVAWESVRKFVFEMFELSDDTSFAREQIIESFHCAILDVADVVCALITPISNKDDDSSSRFLKRALMALFAIVRGVATDLSKQENSTRTFRIKAPHLAPTLYYLVPMLTKFSQHSCKSNIRLRIGDTLSVALQKYFIKLKEKHEEFGLNNALIEAWIRQLSDQEGNDHSYCQNSASTPSPHSGCLISPSDIGACHEVINQTEYSCKASTNGWSNCTECRCASCTRVKSTYQNPYDKKRRKMLHESKTRIREIDKINLLPALNKDELNLLRFEGCIYIERLLLKLCPAHNTNTSVSIDSGLLHRFTMFRFTSFYLLHFFLQDGRIKSSHIKAVVLACVSLAGKTEDYMIPIMRLIQKSKDIPCPSFSNETTNDISSSVVKAYEFQLVNLCGFFLETSSIHPYSHLQDFQNRLKLSKESICKLESFVNDVGYTHSALCLLKSPWLALAAMYLRMGESEIFSFKWISGWQDHLGLNGIMSVVMKEMSRYMEEVAVYVRNLPPKITFIGAPSIHVFMNNVELKEKQMACVRTAAFTPSPEIRVIGRPQNVTKREHVAYSKVTFPSQLSVPSPVNFDVNNQSQRKPKQSTKRKNRSKRENELSPCHPTEVDSNRQSQSKKPLQRTKDKQRKKLSLEAPIEIGCGPLSYSVSTKSLTKTKHNRENQSSLESPMDIYSSLQSDSVTKKSLKRAREHEGDHLDTVHRLDGTFEISREKGFSKTQSIPSLQGCVHLKPTFSPSFDVLRVSFLPKSIIDDLSMKKMLTTFKCEPSVRFFKRDNSDSAIIWFESRAHAEEASTRFKTKRCVGSLLRVSSVGPCLLLSKDRSKLLEKTNASYRYIVHETENKMVLEFNCEKCWLEMSAELEKMVDDMLDIIKSCNKVIDVSFHLESKAILNKKQVVKVAHMAECLSNDNPTQQPTLEGASKSQDTLDHVVIKLEETDFPCLAGYGTNNQPFASRASYTKDNKMPRFDKIELHYPTNDNLNQEADDKCAANDQESLDKIATKVDEETRILTQTSDKQICEPLNVFAFDIQVASDENESLLDEKEVKCPENNYSAQEYIYENAPCTETSLDQVVSKVDDKAGPCLANDSNQETFDESASHTNTCSGLNQKVNEPKTHCQANDEANQELVDECASDNQDAVDHEATMEEMKRISCPENVALTNRSFDDSCNSDHQIWI